MRRLFLVTLILTVTVFAGSSDARTRRVSIPDPMDAIVQVATFQAVAGQQYVAQLQAEQYVEMIVEYLESVPVAAPTVSRPQVAPVVGSAGGGGLITQEQFERLAICEHGGTNGSLYGYYSIMDPRAGSLSMAEQQAWAQRIYDQHGASAWDGCAYTLR